jgi:RNA polymerase sigma factor (sigma-70 family)
METAEMLNDPVSKEINYAQKGFCLQEGPLTVPSAEDTGEEDTEEEDTVSGERGGDSIVSFYIEQLRAIPPLSAEAEKALCKSIKAGEKVIETLIGHWCYLFEVFLNLPEEVLVATVNSCNNSPINYHYTDGVRKNGLHETVLLFEKINALKREHKRSWSALRCSTTKPTCDALHTGAEKITAEISKLISHLTINEQETHKVLAGIEAQVAQEKKGETDWKETKKDLETILAIMSENVLWVKQKKEALIRSHLPLTIHIAKKYLHRGVDFLDLVQEGNQGLMRAVDTFDYRRGNRFTSYAMWWVKQSIIRAIYNQSRTMRIPVYLFDRLHHYLNASEQLQKEMGRKPTLKELAGNMKVSMDALVEMTHAFKNIQSLEEYHQGSGESSGGSARHGSCSQVIIQSDLQDKVNAVLSELSSRESEILKLRFGINGSHYEHSLQEIGKKFNLTRERIRQIEKSALLKLKKMNSIQELREFLI